jgi:AcrR family transcriptional regulator
MEARGERSAPLFPKLAARPNGSPAAVAAHQRARLHAAMIEACARHGYAATTARELAALAGVSTKAIYRHFGSKDGCLLATYDVVVQQAAARISTAYRDGRRGPGGDTTIGIRRAFDAFAAELADHPDASRLALIEILAAGPAALPRIQRAEAAFTMMICAGFARATDGRAIPSKLVRALIGGVWLVAGGRLVRPDPGEIAASGAELREWLMSYRLPPDAVLPLGAVAGRASTRTRRIDRGNLGRSAMLAAAATIVARGGHDALSPAAVTEVAGVPAGSFDAEFEDVDACFLAMLDWLCADAFAEALRDGDGAPSWGSGVYRAVRSMLCRVATDPALARAAFVDAFRLGPAGHERRAALLRGFARSLLTRAPANRRPPTSVAEAIVGSIWSLVQRQVSTGRRGHLPALVPGAAFLAMAPVIGAEPAVALIAAEQERETRQKIKNL